MRLVLASASPARLAVLQAAGLDPDVVVSDVDESGYRAEDTAALVQVLADAKADEVAGRIGGDALVIGCDSLLDLDGRACGKPSSVDEARERWALMRGRSGTLHTGHALIELRDGTARRSVRRNAATTVHFGHPSEAELTAYLATGEPLAVAGAFTLDGLGGWFVDRIEGDPSNVIGISLPLVRAMLGELGLTPAQLWSGSGR